MSATLIDSGMQVHPFYRNNGLRLHEIPVGQKHPSACSWQASAKNADDVEPLLDGETYNKYGWLLDNTHVVIDIDVHEGGENGYRSLENLESKIGFKLEDSCGAVVETPSGGRHYYFSKPASEELGKVFAKHYPGIDFINGHGKQVIAAGSCHDKYPGKVYTLGADAKLLPIPNVLLEHLQSLGSVGAPFAPVATNPGDSERSGDEFNKTERGLLLLLSELAGRGYVVRSVGDYYEFDRPGKTTDSKCSGHVGKRSKSGNYQLTCFSLSDPVFPSNESMTIFHAYSLLCCHGDQVLAARALYERGFAADVDTGSCTMREDVDRLISGATRSPENTETGNDAEPSADDLYWRAQDEKNKNALKAATDFASESLGFISEVMRYTLDQAHREQPVYAMAGAIALQATLIGRRVADESGTRSNVYILCVGGSSSGKDMPRKVNNWILSESGNGALLLPEEFTSDTAIYRNLAKTPAGITQTDEIGRVLSSISNSSNPHSQAIMTALMKLFTSAESREFIAKSYADASTRPDIVLREPCMILFGTATPSQTYDGLGHNAVEDGFLGRCLLFESKDMPTKKRPKRKPVPQDILEIARYWGEFGRIQPEAGSNLLDCLRPESSPKLLTISRTAGAETLLAEFDEYSDAELERSADKPGGILWGRAGEKASQLALIAACSLDKDKPIIDEAAMVWAINVVRGVTYGMCRIAENHLAYNLQEKSIQKAEGIIRSCGAKGIMHREFLAATRWMGKRERDDARALMLSCEKVVIEPVGRTCRYVWVAG